MDANTQLLIQISENKLEEIIQKAVTKAVGSSAQKPPVKENQLYTRKETAKLFHISEVTLDAYTSQGLIDAVRIGARILYSSEAIEKALNKMEARKAKRS